MNPIDFDNGFGGDEFVVTSLAALVTLALTWGLNKFATKANATRVRAFIPLAAVIIAVALVAFVNFAGGADVFTVETLFGGVLAAGQAVLAHDQFRAIVRRLLAKPDEGTPQNAPERREGNGAGEPPSK